VPSLDLLTLRYEDMAFQLLWAANAPTSSVPSLSCLHAVSGPASGPVDSRSGGHGADLLQQAKAVLHGPGLGDLAVDNPIDPDR